MKLFEIDEALMNCFDDETGEINEEMYELLTEKREEKIESLLCWYKNLCSDAEQLKEQENIFKERRQTMENKAERLKNYIEYALAGEKFETAKVKVSYRKSKAVEVSEDFVKWAQDNDRDDLLTYKEPTVSKTAVKKALEYGETIPAQIVENINMSIK